MSIPSASFVVGNDGSGSLTLDGGNIIGYGAQIANSITGTGDARVKSGTWSTTGAFNVGNNGGQGTLLVNGGYIESKGNFSIANNSSSSGSVTVSSGTLSLASADIGSSTGTGVLNVTGGQVKSTGNIFIGRNVDGSGKAIVSSGTWTAANISIGNNGNQTGALEVNGGVVDSSGTINLATNATSAGSIKVTDGSLNVSTLSVGQYGAGSMTISGGIVSSTYTYLTNQAGSSAEVALTGGTWNAGSLYVGQTGTGSLTVDGGLITATNLAIGQNSAGHGILAITGGTVSLTSGSTTIGSSGTGELNISGGLVSAKAIAVSSYNSGNAIINLSGSEGKRGILEATSIAKVLTKQGAASIVLDGGILRATSTQSSFISSDFAEGEIVIEDGGAYIDSNGFDIGIGSSLSGNGGLIKQGTGVLTLGASSSYSGGTIIEAGKVVANANHALGTGGVAVKSGTLSVSSGAAFENAVTLEGSSLFERGIASGTSLANAFDLSSSGEGGTTGAKILGGTSSATVTLQAGFSATSSASNDELRLGNVLHLSGMKVLDSLTGETDVFVLELAMSDITEIHRLGWFDTETNEWVNAVEGNIGGTAKFFGRGYNAETDFVLGYYGIDVENGTVWAVLNHNSDFAVIPEPGSWALLALGAGAVLGWRKRRGGVSVAA